MKKSNYILIFGICAVAACLFVAAYRIPKSSVPTPQPVKDTPQITNNSEQPVLVSSQPQTHRMKLVRKNIGTNANPPEEVFKVVFDEMGHYVCTDTGRQMYYLKSKTGNTIGPVDILKYLNINPNPTNRNAKITGMEMVDSNLVIYVDGQAHVVKLHGDGGGHN